jgi:EAL domain-containing protein (putative c-di-GMP-specific phosphodiesterase class I)
VNVAAGSPKGIADRLISALQEDEFVLYFQTIRSLSSEAANRPFQEIFVRFKEEDAKLLPPGAFFGILEEFHLMPYLDRWVINRLARWVRGALNVKADWEVPRSNVNLSPDTLVDPHFSRYVRQFVENSYLSHGALGFEMTWDRARELEEPLKRFLAELLPHGCCFTLADFDGSETSFGILERVAPNYVRLSARVVNNICNARDEATKLAEINLRCELLGIKTIAENVESNPLITELKRTGTHFVQGFAVSAVQPLL